MSLFSTALLASPPRVVPYGTVRIVENNLGGYTYYGKSGVIARSRTNNFGGDTYSDLRGVNGRTSKTVNGYRFNYVGHSSYFERGSYFGKGK